MEFLTKIVDQMNEPNKRTFENLLQFYRRKGVAEGAKTTADGGSRRVVLDDAVVKDLRANNEGFDKGMKLFSAAYEKQKTQAESVRGKVSPEIVEEAQKPKPAPVKKAAAKPADDSPPESDKA